MKIVNGYVCDCQDEVRLARRGTDPDNPRNDPVKQQELDAKRGVADPRAIEDGKPGDFDPGRRAEDGPAVVFGGTLTGEAQSGRSDTSALPLLDLVV